MVEFALLQQESSLAVGCMQGAVYEVVATGVGGGVLGGGGLHAGCCV